MPFNCPVFFRACLAVSSARSRVAVAREVFVMRYIQQESYEQIAQELGKRPHQVRALCSKAMSQLRSMLNSSGSKIGKKGVSDA